MTTLRDEVIKASKTKTAKQEMKKGWDWYEKHVRIAAARMSANQFLVDNQAHAVHRPELGDLMFFHYDPKTKEKLPYYDVFPMIIPIPVLNEKKIDKSKYFFGVNLHYLDPHTRAAIFDELSKYKTDDKSSKATKLTHQWSVLSEIGKASSESKGPLAGCVKKYLFSHVKSKFIVVPPSEWKYVIWLPLERFHKESSETVWSKTNG